MQGTDQIRQAFSKRKRGLALKCYQLHKLTDAKVRCMRSLIIECASWQRAAVGKFQCSYKYVLTIMLHIDLTYVSVFVSSSPGEFFELGHL